MKVKIDITGKMMLCEYASKEVLMAEAKDDLDTGEVRTYEYNTRKCIVLKMTVKMRDTLNYIEVK